MFRSFSDGAEWDESYAYDNLDRMTAATKGPIPHSFGWDALSRQTSEGQIYGSVARQFDLAGRMTRLTWADMRWALAVCYG